MKKNHWIFLFVFVLIANLAAVYSGNEALRFITKPLLMPLLVFHFVSETKNIVTSLKKWIVFALIFSWCGDLLLMFESKSSSFFIFGLVSFLIAHIFYILFYMNVIRIEAIKKNLWLFLPVLLYYIALIYLLSPPLGDMSLPVRIYGIVISYMLVQALQTGYIKNKRAAFRMIAGAILFIISDSLLAINKFYQPFENAGILIMFTYGVAQLLITLGSELYITSVSKQ